MIGELGAQYISKSTDIADEELYEELLRTKQFGHKLPVSSIRGLHNTAIDMEHYEAPEGLSSVAEISISQRHGDTSRQSKEDVSKVMITTRQSTTSEAFDKIVLTRSRGSRFASRIFRHDLQ